MQIYFGDLSHDTVGLATEVFPLNVAYVAAYAKKEFGDHIQVRLFKYLPELEDAIEREPPDILAMSNYPWCHNMDLAVFRLLDERRPEALRVMGGANFPHAPEEQRDFLARRPLIDAYAYLEGETPFANLLRFVRDSEGLAEARQRLKALPVEGCAQLGEDGALVAVPTPIRIRDLNDIPSPYLTGLMDPFFDGRLSPMFQTNRGCPFKCTFCADGSDLVNKVHHFSLERIKDELTYIADRVPETIKGLHIADLNFGMYKHDAEICDMLGELKRKFDYPLYVDTATGKNSKKRIIAAMEKLEGVLYMDMAVQSMTPDVLKNIKRDNIRLDDFLGLTHAIKTAKVPTLSEIILGLPGETKESHFDAINQLMMSEIEVIIPYTLMLLNGSELATPVQREMWGFQTKFRVLPRDFSRLKNGRKVIEIEEVVVASNTMSYEDYVQCRKMALLISIFNTVGFMAVLKLLLQNHIRPMDLFLILLESTNDLPEVDDSQKGLRLFQEFEKATRNELWDSAEELTAFFDDDENFQGLVEGRYGANLIQTFKAQALAHCSDDLAEIFFREADAVLLRHTADESILETMRQAQSYCRGLIWNILGADRLEVVPTTDLDYDFASWIGDPEQKSLTDFSWETKRRVAFVLSDKQYRLVEEGLDRFGRHDLGLGKVLLRLNPNVLWRNPVLEENTPQSATPEKIFHSV
jgi:radical SAM superfamily enzyme YgiQ (UPF0313 family)